MRIFRKKSGSQGHQEYLGELINSIRQARREEAEKQGLHAFVEEDYFPGQPDTPASRTPGPSPAANTPAAGTNDEAAELASLEAYLKALEAAEGEEMDARQEGGDTD